MKSLNIILDEDIKFLDLISKMENVFNLTFPYKNVKGRLIAEGRIEDFTISIIDKEDDLGDFLCDDYYTLEIKVSIVNINEEKIEIYITNLFEKHYIKWIYGIWAPAETQKGPYRKIFPDKETEVFYR